ncbi:MAG: NUDIX domain-containing protein [Clostridia bacterium]|nr:NUDIX domain-containing protein [Clostridia bacterium]
MVCQSESPKEIDIYGDNRFETYSKIRSGCRAVIVREGMIQLSHETETGWYMVPGGGMEAEETPEMCCVREVEEETGVIVRPLRHYLTINEYYEEYRYIDYYFVCEPVGQGTIRLTEAERRRGLEPLWLPLNEAVEMFSRHQDYAAVSEEKRGVYLREYVALSEYLKQYQAG